ncbi:MAG: hypothetical protein KBG15_16615, partial [Kofleriaceae bacterium]|nr:hypothetical protein [Kofleriaceae bacterium]
SKAGLLLGVQRYGLNVGGAARVTPDLYAMAYDPFGRLINVTRNGNFFGGYEYDKADRLTRFQEGAANAATPTTFVQDKLTARTNGNEVRTWTYDASGNTTQDVRVATGAGTRTRNHSWDALGRYVGFVEVGAAQTSYFYTPGGELARVTAPGGQVNSSDYLHVGAYARKDMTTGAWIDRIIGANGAIAELRGPRIEMAHKTFGQSVAAVSNDLGAILRQEEFKPYGKVLAAAQAPSVGPTGGWEERFHGIRGDELMVAGGRAYDAERGSWLSRDPLAISKPSAVVGDVRLGAMYGFNNGDPYRFRDPTGRCSGCPGDILDHFVGRITEAAKDAVHAIGSTIAPVTDFIPGVGVGVRLGLGDYKQAAVNAAADGIGFGFPKLIGSIAKLGGFGAKTTGSGVSKMVEIVHGTTATSAASIKEGVAVSRSAAVGVEKAGSFFTQISATGYRTSAQQAGAHWAISRAVESGGTAVVMTAKVPSAMVQGMLKSGEAIITNGPGFFPPQLIFQPASFPALNDAIRESGGWFLGTAKP